MSEVWAKWEGQVIEGTFPLQRCLGGSDHSGVFLTGYASRNPANAALKLVPAIPTLADSQLAHWTAAAELSHPSLIRLFATGRCQLGNLHCLYAVMEYAEQNLAQLLRHRALTDTEALEMLPPVLDALAFLHASHLVQGQLRPSNILVVGDRLKLASDTIRPVGAATTSLSMSSVYDPPEARDGSFSSAGDIWALGVTLFEALTQGSPARPDQRGSGVVLPPDFPPAFSDVVRRCMSRNPADRPSVEDLGSWIKWGPGEATVSEPRVGAAPAQAADEGSRPPPALAMTKPTIAATSDRLVIRAMVERETPPQEPPERRSFVPLIFGAVALFAVCWVGVRLFMTRHNSGAPPSAVSKPAASSADSLARSAPNPQETPSPAARAESSQLAPNSAAPTAAANPTSAAPQAVSASSVVHEEIPTASRSALTTIHGHVRVTVRVTVDASGAVVGAALDNPGPSKYFARLAAEAARKWKFVAASGPASRQWLLHFEFSRTGAMARAVARP